MATSTKFDITVPEDEEQQPLLGSRPEETDDEKDPDKAQHARAMMRSLKGDMSSKSFARRSTRLGTSFMSLIRGAPATQIEPNEALVPLIQGTPPPGTHARPAPVVKSIPYRAPYRRFARHRSFYLWWINEFRHWWKSSRLLVRLGGMETYAADPIIWSQLTTVDIMRRKGFKQAFKLGKRMGQGGGMRAFLQICQPFTRTIRIVVATWRWIEAAKPRRLEVGVEEAMVSFTNRLK